MPSENIAAFNLQVLRVIAALYKAHPKAIDIDIDAVTGSDQNDAEANTYASGTITWLYRNGFVTGKLRDDRIIAGAQLSSSTLKLLQRKYPDAPRYTIGQQVSQALDTAGSHSGRTAELLMQFLLGELS